LKIRIGHNEIRQVSKAYSPGNLHLIGLTGWIKFSVHKKIMKQLFISVILFTLISSCGDNSSGNTSKENNQNKQSKEAGPTADDIISKNIEARGGYDKVNSLQTIIFEGTSLGKGKVAMKVYYDHLKAMRSDFTTNGKTGYNIQTTNAAWYFNPFTDKAPVQLDEALAKDGVFQLDIHGLFVDYKKKGYQAIYEGKDTAAGKQCFKIKLTKAGEKDKTYFFDETYMLSKTIISRLMSGGNYLEGWNCYYDYRKNEDGYLFSYRRTSSTGQTLFDKVTTNTSIPASVFEPGN